MVVIVVRCETCGTDKLYKDTCYRLEIERYGESKTCEACGHTKTKHDKYDYTFCSRKCLTEFLDKHKDEKYKYMWEK